MLGTKYYYFQSENVINTLIMYIYMKVISKKI